MAQKNFKNFDNKLNDINVSRFNSAFFLSPIEFVNKEPSKENNYLQNLENQTLKIEVDNDTDHISSKKDYHTPRSIDTNLKKCLGQDLLKHLDESPMRQHKYLPTSNFGQNKNSFFYKKISNSNDENEFSIDRRNENNLRLNKIFKLSILPGSNTEILKKKFNDDFFIGMPLKAEEAYFLYEKNLCRNFISLEDYNKYYQINNDLNRLQYLKAEIFQKILGNKDNYFSFYLPLNKARSFYFNCDYNKILKSQSENFDNFYMGNDYKEKTEEELINLNNSDEFKNEFMEQNKNFDNFNFSQASNNESSACKNINSLGKNKFNSNFDYENEDDENIYSSIFSTNKIKKSNSSNYLKEFEHKIPFDPELFSTDNNNLEKIFHSPNFYHYNSHSKEKNIIDDENANDYFNYAYNQSNVTSQNKKNSLSNSNLKKFAQSSISNINPQAQSKYIGLLKVNQNNQNLQNADNFENLKNASNKNTQKKIFDESTSAYSNMQKNIPNLTPNSEFSREMQANNLIAKNKNSLLYPNYSDFSDQLNIPNINNSNKSNPNFNPYSNKNLNTNNNEIIYEQNHDYDSEHYGMSHLEDYEHKKDIEGENIINNILNDDLNYTPKRRDHNDESFDNRNFETFDCCNIDSFINPGLANNTKSSFHNTAVNNQNNKMEDAVLNVNEGNNYNKNRNNFNNPLGNKINEIIDKRFTANDDFNARNPFNRSNTFNMGMGLKTDTGPSPRKPALNISDDICFIPKSIRKGVASGNLIKNNLAENQNDNNKNNDKNESLYNIMDNFKNFTNLSENNLKSTNRNPNMNNYFNNNDNDNRNIFYSQSNKNINANTQNKIDQIKKEDANNIINQNQFNQQKFINQNNMSENNEDMTSSDYPNSTSSYSQSMNMNIPFNNQGINNKNMNQAANMQMTDKHQKQANQSSQNKTGWVCSQCKNFNYESKNYFKFLKIFC